MLPTLRQLHYLKLLDEHGSFSRAAEAAHVTQPTLSAGVQELERILGAPLVDRNRSGIILTAAGAEVVVRAGAILAQAEELVEGARAAGKPLAGRFRLGVIPTIAPFLLPLVLPALRQRFPKLKLYLREDLTHRLIADLKAGGLDAALIALPYAVDGLEWAHVGEDELLAAFPFGHPFEASDKIDPRRLEGEDLILLDDGHCLRDHALTACGLPARGAARERGFSATSLATLVQMVGSGLGVSFLPAMAVDAGLARAASVSVRSLDAHHARREIVLAWRAGSRRAAEGQLLAAMFGSAQARSPGVEDESHERGDDGHGGEACGDAGDPQSSEPGHWAERSSAA
jgi:LysR family hydrogen peroxide-inducible transcriptional activator